jgi:hypothetical protein
MAPAHLFSIANTVAALCWLALMAAPLRWRWPRQLAVTAALALAMAYAALVGAYIREGQGSFSSLAGVASLFQHPGILVAGWVHYLAFDLLVGTWERDEAKRIGLARWLLVPCQFVTFMFGPLGWLLFMAARRLRLQSMSTASLQPGVQP